MVAVEILNGLYGFSFEDVKKKLISLGETLFLIQIF